MAKSSDIDQLSGRRLLQQKLYLPCLTLGSVVILAVIFMPFIGQVGMANPKTAQTIGLWVHFLGGLHPVFLHLPIGALTLVLVMEFLRCLSRGKYKPQTTIGLFFTAVTGVLALIFGYCLYLTGDFEGELIEEHKRDGIIFTVFVILTFLVKYTTDLHPNKKKWKALYVFLLLASGGAMIGAGHHGGEITHGNPLDSLPSKILAARKSHTLDENLVIYTELIHPILEEKCISCHGSKKKKSGLRMDTYRHMLAGGDEGECLVPGDLKKSGLITTLHLPLDDDLRMPPQDKPQLTNDEIKLLEWWVKAGAPETSTLGEIERSAEIDKALESTLGN